MPHSGLKPKYKNDRKEEDDLSKKCKFLYYLNKMTMTIHLDFYATTDYKPEVLSGVETGNRIPHDE